MAFYIDGGLTIQLALVNIMIGYNNKKQNFVRDTIAILTFVHVNVLSIGQGLASSLTYSTVKP